MVGHNRPMRFHATIELRGKTACGISVPVDVVRGLGASRKPAVSVTINGYTYRSTIASMGGEYMLSVNPEVRAAAGIRAGDEVDVDIELDTAPREITVQPDFAAALEADSDAKRFFDSLSYSNKRRFTLSIEDARTPETRQRRIQKSVAALREGRI